MSDPIADMLNRIINAQAVSKPIVEIPFSIVKFRIAEILNEKGFILDFKKRIKKRKKYLIVILKYLEGNRPAISGFKRVSKPGQRIYKKAKEIKPVKNGYGLSIISTSKGIVDDSLARKQKLGGEVICEVW
ncbi:30S ribosomal protein S8 [bacterium]|nr:30S ribosomal protein S8 [bacterium]